MRRDVRRKDCPDPEALSRAFSEQSDQYQVHLLSCASCRDEWQSNEALQALARELPVRVPSDAEVQQQQNDLVARALSLPTKEPASNRPLLSLAAALLVAVILGGAYAALLATPAAEDPLSRIQPSSNAQFTQVRLGEQKAESQTELIRLSSGQLAVTSEDPKEEKERRLVTGDALLEIHSRDFIVTADNDQLSEVIVRAGFVKVIRQGEPPTIVRMGAVWRAATHKLKKREDRAYEKAFEAGFQALQRGEPSRAIEHFDRAIEQDPSARLSEDARYWQITACLQDGRNEQAVLLGQRFLRSYPSSPRRAEVSLLLGWSLLNRGDLDQAEQHLRAAARSSSRAVSSSARRGLAVLEERR